MQRVGDAAPRENSHLEAFNIAFGADAPSARAQVTDEYVFDDGATACFTGGDQEHKAIPESIRKLDKPVEVKMGSTIKSARRSMLTKLVFPDRDDPRCNNNLL